MSRKNNRSRRRARRERKESYKRALKAFNEKYPLRGTIPGPTLLNFMAYFRGREYADARLREATDPLKFDNILMKKRRELYDEFIRNGNWKRGVDHLPKGWAKIPPKLDMEPVIYEDLEDHTKFQKLQ